MASTYSLPISPSAKGSLSYGWKKLKDNFLPLFLIVLILSILNTPLQILQKNPADKDSALGILLEFLAFSFWLLFYPVITYSADLLFVKAVRNEKIDIKEIIAGFKNYLDVILAHLLTTALIGISLIVLIIPGIIVACRLAFVSYLVMDKQMDPIASVEESWRMTKGHTWKIFSLGFISIFIFILGLICFIVGMFPAIIWIKTSFAALYQTILNQREEIQLAGAGEAEE